MVTGAGHVSIRSSARVGRGAAMLFGIAAATWSCSGDREDATHEATSRTALSAAELPPPPPAPSQEAFAGTASCSACHAEQFTAWRTSTHGRAGGVPSGAGSNVRVIAPFDGTPIRFRDATVIPRQERGVFSFVVQRPGERDTALLVAAVIGGGHMAGGGTQGFVTAAADGTLRFLPFDWSRDNRTWFCNTGTRAKQGWRPISIGLRLADCGDWPPSRVLGDEPRFSNCQGCHGSQIDLAFDTLARTWRTRQNGFDINCESCHGPAARHVAIMKRGNAPTADIGLEALGTLDKDRSLATCLSCHALKDRLAPNWRPGVALSAYYAVRLPQLGDKPFTPDGRTRTFAYQEGHLASDCYRNGGMTCVSCHDPHSQGYRTVDGTPLPGRTDDRQCTGCHASKAVRPELHTRHRPASTGSRCVSCHMPYQQQHELGNAIRYARSDHSIAIPRPTLDSSLGIVSACRSCHASVGEARHMAQVRQWWGALKPHESAVAGVLAAASAADIGSATELLLHPDSRNATAQVAGLVEWLERYAKADMTSVPATFEARLVGLATTADPDVRALSLALLHYTRGQVAETRRYLRQQRRDQGGSDGAVARRWAVVLGGIGDGLRGAGDAAGAVVAYQKALEVSPNDAAILVNLGLALADAGDLPGAVGAYQQSLRKNARQPLAEVNLGIALERGGDAAGAAAAYRRSIDSDPGAPLGYLNLGTSLLRAERAADAIPYFEKALARDPGLAIGHFQLALAWLRQGELSNAATSVRRSLALDGSNPEAVKLDAALRDAMRDPVPGARTESRSKGTGRK